MRNEFIQLRNMRLVVTGGRLYRDRELVFSVLDELHPVALAHGACPYGSEELPVGADWYADEWGRANGLVVGETLIRYPAEKRYGRLLGPERNRRMLDEFLPDLVVRFPGGYGTVNCALEAAIRGIRIDRRG